MSARAVSVVVPTVGRVRLLEQCLTSILACDPAPAEVLVVDQSHSDVVAVVVRNLGPPVRAVVDPGVGTASAMNVGLAAATYDRVLVTHDDCTVSPDWVGVGTALSERHPDAILTGRVLPPSGSVYVPSTKTDPSPRDYTGSITSGVLYPANMVVDRRRIIEIGGFDERRTLLVAEDNDLCYRWLRSGRPFRYEPSLVVWHHDWRSPAELVRTHIAYARAQGGFYAKHLYARDREVLRLLRWDLRHAIRSTLKVAARRRHRWEEPYREMLGPLLLGVLSGLREARALGRRSG